MDKVKIEDVIVGSYVTDSHGVKETILEKTSSSVLVTSTKRTKEGINCKSWVTIEDFNKRYTI